MAREQFDAEETRCLQLGGPVTFNYCRRMNAGLPCRLVIGCWQGRLEVLKFLAENFTGDELRRAFTPPPGSKLQRLVTLIERSKAAHRSADDSGQCPVNLHVKDADGAADKRG
jgi:hypothetical protein